MAPASNAKRKAKNNPETAAGASDEKSLKLASLSSKDKGLQFERKYTQAGASVFDAIEWESRESKITEPDGTVVFEMKDVRIPKGWSQLATDIVASKYFRKAGVEKNKEGHEKSVQELVYRVAHTIRTAGDEQKVFATADDANSFEDELSYLLVNQMGAFNSPVWFNCGLNHEYGIEGSGGNYYWSPELKSIETTQNAYAQPQCSACFIQSVSDDLMDIFELSKNEARLFKYGSGSGTNFSKIRGRQEKLSGGGSSSGLMSFLEVLDKGAGATKSGGTTRRAAKMVTLDMDHPEIVDFINWKANEEKKAKALIAAGWDSNFNGEAYHTVSGQNSNNSVRVSDDFMNAVVRGDQWETTYRTSGEVCETFDAKWMMKQIAEAAWQCADPGIQFDTTINDWHTSANTDRIYGSNPCSEYMFLNDSACNLASLNLTKYVDDEGNFLVDEYKHACRIFITAQEILVDFASYPTKVIAQNSHDYRPLGLGFANLGTLLMCWGIPYDSDKGRAISASLMSIMCGTAYEASAEIAGTVGAFPGYAENKEPMMKVMQKHQEAANKIDARMCSTELFKAAQDSWADAIKLGKKNGYRNAQTTVLAPTGTIGLLMDCDTTGVEPEFSLVKWKKLAGGGTFKIVNNSVPLALGRMGYDSKEVEEINKYILEKGTIEGAPSLKEEDLPVFDCANKCGDGTRYIEAMGHVRMMAAVQPFISGAISKTVNLPSHVTVGDIEKIYMEAWRLGLKAIALYRDGSKGSQPLNTSAEKEKEEEGLTRGDRQVLPQMRKGFTLESSIRGHKMFLRTGEYADGQLGEIFIDMYKEGAAYRSIINCLAISVSIGLQYGVPLEKYVNSFTFTRFDPQGPADHPNIKMCTSLVDFVFRVLGMHYLGRTDFVHLKPKTVDEIPENGDAAAAEAKLTGPGDAVSVDLPIAKKQEAMDEALAEMMGDAPICEICGHVTVRNGSCYKCLSCGNSMGCS